MVQHAQSVHHLNGMIGSWTDWDLSELGVRQAECLGERLAGEWGGQIARVCSSDLLRARHTAEIVARRLGLTVELDPRLREQNLGEAVGKSVEWAHAHTLVWQRAADDRPFAGAETQREVWARLEPLVAELLAGPEERTVLVSHGGTICLLIALWLGMDVEKLDRFGVSGLAAGVSVLRLTDDGKRILRRLNDPSFARESPARDRA